MPAGVLSSRDPGEERYYTHASTLPVHRNWDISELRARATGRGLSVACSYGARASPMRRVGDHCPRPLGLFRPGAGTVPAVHSQVESVDDRERAGEWKGNEICCARNPGIGPHPPTAHTHRQTHCEPVVPDKEVPTPHDYRSGCEGLAMSFSPFPLDGTAPLLWLLERRISNRGMASRIHTLLPSVQSFNERHP